MKVQSRCLLPAPPRGFSYYKSQQEVLDSPEMLGYQHMLLRSWKEMALSGVLALDGIPTVYVRDEDKPLTVSQAAKIHGQFWNQGVATVLLLREPGRARVFSSMTVPIDPKKATDADIEERLVETIDLATQASWNQQLEKLYLRIGTGALYRQREDKFDPQRTVDAYLLENLTAVRNELVRQGLKPQFAHAFLGRLLFTCYLCDRGILKLSNHFTEHTWTHLHELLAGCGDPCVALYDNLFPALKHDFNGSMFDEDLTAERALMKPKHFNVVLRFLQGDEIALGHGQRSLGFWAYDFKFIPVETISAIYESFLEGEDDKVKRASGAFYTPRFLAEMALDLALEEQIGPLYTKDRRYIDPSCGSGIFLVLLFNRLAAEWRSAQTRKAVPQAKADAMLERLDALRGVDKNLTACRIACFSLYLAFLDQFDPPDIESYKLRTNKKKLPNILRVQDAKRSPEHPVIWEGDFFDIAPKWKSEFDLVIGNPPWAGRGTKQIAQRFLEEAPALLKDDGRACLIVPSKVLLNQTDVFQSRWLKAVTLKTVVQLADYSFILFKEALCPANIVLFSSQTPNTESHEIQYIAPKVSRSDLRDGVIPVAPQDRKWIPLRHVLSATEQKASAVAWKSHLWGTPCDGKLLDYLFTFPRLSEQVDVLSKTDNKRARPWAAGQGCKPRGMDSKSTLDRKLRPLGSWSPQDPFVTDSVLEGMPFVPREFCPTLAEHFKAKGYLPDKLYSKPADALFNGPLVLFSQGFSEFGFFDYTVRFQHALQSIAGPNENELLFLTAYLRSKLARYVVFQTAANIATERDKAHLFEVLRLPFYLPGAEAAQPKADSIMEKVSSMLRRTNSEMKDSAAKLQERLNSTTFKLQSNDEDALSEARAKWFQHQRAKTLELQSEINTLIYDYFGLTDQERAIVVDTCDIFDRSDTPGSLSAARGIPTLQPLDAKGLEPYAMMLTDSLNSCANGPLRTSATGGVDSESGLGLVELSQTRTLRMFNTRSVSKQLAFALRRLQDASAEIAGKFLFQRSGWFFDGPRIYLVKPALRGQWTRTAALNDAAEIHAQIAEARRSKAQIR